MVKSSPKILTISARSLQKLPSDDGSSSQNSPAERSVRTEQPDSVDSHSSNKDAGRWTQLLTLSLQNTGSVARDHLSSERTWLAYVRTSLSIASAGVGGFENLLFVVDFNHPNSSRSALCYRQSYGSNRS